VTGANEMQRGALTSPSGELNQMDHRSSSALALTVHSTFEWAAGRAQLRRWIADRAGDRDSNDVVLACGEAVDNAFEHGRSPVTIELQYEPEGDLEILVRDHGSWRVSVHQPPRGLGLPIMTALMDNVTIDTTNGTALRLSRRLSSRPEGESWSDRANPGPPKR
jgi:anti-sigma regulatory factor (Ser/Thr protein kinase)